MFPFNSVEFANRLLGASYIQSIVLGSRKQAGNRQYCPLQVNTLEWELDVYPTNLSTSQCCTVSLVGGAQARYGWKVDSGLLGGGGARQERPYRDRIVWARFEGGVGVWQGECEGIPGRENSTWQSLEVWNSLMLDGGRQSRNIFCLLCIK